MKDFLSNAWVVSIISGIIVFFLTNAIIMLQNRRKHKKQINDANTIILNRLRGYVVDNGLPQREVINAVKSSTAREYNVKYDELLTIKEFCEELITDIIGNVYISNDNKVKYIDMLNDYLKEKNNLREDEIKIKQIEENNKTNNNKNNKMKNSYLDSILSMITAILAFIGTLFISLKNTEFEIDKLSDINIAILIITILFIMLSIFIITKGENIIKWFSKWIK